MKRYFWLAGVLTALILTAGSCRKADKYTSDAIITGFDLRKCMCCGGLMITFNGEPRPYVGDFKLIDNSADLGISINETFPIYVNVEWISDPYKCLGNYIKVTKLKRL